METGSQRLGRIVASFQPDLSGFPGTAEKENTKVERTGMAHVLPDQNGSSPFYCRHAPLLHEPGDFDAPRTPVPEITGEKGTPELCDSFIRDFKQM